jgi:hypothetical protein
MRDKGDEGGEMNETRKRAWLLLRVKDPKRAVTVLKEYKNFEEEKEESLNIFEAGGDEWVVVRADIVTRFEGKSDDDSYNLVIPIDAKDDETLEWVVKKILELTEEPAGVERITVLLVDEHYPPLAVEAHCYITEQETDDEHYPERGRYPRSPGENPWG